MVGKVTDNCKASASLLPAIMGHSQWSTPNETLDGVLAHISGTAEEWTGNEATGWGNTLEGVVISETAKRLKIRDYNPEIDYAIKHPTIELECSLDAEADGAGQIIRTDAANGIFCMGADEIKLVGKGALESKVTSFRPEDVPDLGRGPLQLQGQMMCGGYNWGAVGILYQGIALRVFVFEPHAPTIAAIEDAVRDFDDRLRSNPTRWYDINSPADAALIYGEVEESEKPKELDDSFFALADEYNGLKSSIKEANAAIDLITVKFQEAMGNHSTATVDGYEIKWPMRHTKAQPEKVTPAKEATSKRQKTITVKETKA
tara:strand:+ start:135 stop:1085 length:951 start_codon:yes stop_codon:yes gene_type:complete